MSDPEPAGVESRLSGCCDSSNWTKLVAAGWPYESGVALLEASERAFDELVRDDWMQAFGAHARIGEPRIDDARGSAEQAGVESADELKKQELARLNADYERRFDYVFLICATGLSATQMLEELRERIENSAEAEFANACAEQRKITALRLRAMLAA